MNLNETKLERISTNKTAVKFWTKFYEKQGIKYVESKEKHDDLEVNVQIFNV
jgi:predicted acetyltransferase